VRAYEKLQEHLMENHDALSDCEYTILLGYIISIFAHQYEFRPYMINKNISRETDWVMIYNQLFDGFIDENRDLYANN
jgi:hypothetical protein